MSRRRTLKGNRVFSLESSILLQQAFTIEVCPKVIDSLYIDRAIVVFDADNGNIIEVIPKSIEFESDNCLKLLREESDCLVRYITQKLTFHYSVLHQASLKRDDLHEEVTADDNRIIVEASQGQCADIEAKDYYFTSQEAILKLQDFLNKDNKEQDIYSDMFYAALGMTDPIAIYMSLYAIGLYLCDREQQYQSEFDDFICKEFQEKKSFESRKRRPDKNKNKKTSKNVSARSEEVEKANPEKKAEVKKETQYTYLRNRLAHFENSSSKDSGDFYSLSRIRCEMYSILPKLKCIVKKAITTKSVIQ